MGHLGFNKTTDKVRQSSRQEITSRSGASTMTPVQSVMANEPRAGALCNSTTLGLHSREYRTNTL
jgi:hypothetical protein